MNPAVVSRYTGTLDVGEPKHSLRKKMRRGERRKKNEAKMARTQTDLTEIPDKNGPEEYPDNHPLDCKQSFLQRKIVEAGGDLAIREIALQ